MSLPQSALGSKYARTLLILRRDFFRSIMRFRETSFPRHIYSRTYTHAAIY
jgi:hypothetical protein